MTTPTPDRSAPIHIRRSKMYDAPALARLAALDSRRLPRGSFLVAEVAGELVAAASLESDDPALGDPFYPTQDLRHFLDLQAGSIRKRQRRVRESSPFARFLHEAKRVLNDAPSASSRERLGSYRTDSTG